MLFLPIVERELRVVSRNWRTYYGRTLAGAIALAISAYLLVFMRAAFGNASGDQILVITSVITMALCIYSGVTRTADSISSEKREDTLGLLFLTHLTALDVILGKLTSSALHALYLLVGILPILGIPILLGGVTGNELFRISIALLNALFFALAFGILASTLLRSQRSAHALGGGIVTVFAIIFPAAAFLLQRLGIVPWLIPFLSFPSPGFALQMSFGGIFAVKNSIFWEAIALQQGMALAALIASALILPHSWKTKPAVPWDIKGRIARWTHGNLAARAARRFRMLNVNPIFWLNSRDRFGALWPALLTAATLSLTFGLSRYFEIPREPSFVLFLIAIAFNDFAMRVRVASLGSLRFGQDRQSGALELILSTPITISEILFGQWIAIFRKTMWTYMPLMAVYLVTISLFVEEVDPFLVGFFALMSIGDFIAIGYVAMWKGVHLRKVEHASGAAVLRVVVMPWFFWGFFMASHGFNFVREIFREFGDPTFTSAVFIWTVSTVTAIRSARRNLYSHFREAATDRYIFEQRTSLFTRLRKLFDNPLTINLLQSRRPPVLD